MSDKRLIPEFGPKFWAHRKSERRWHYCKYCYRNVPTFIFSDGEMGNLTPLSQIRCCWECGSGLEPVVAPGVFA
jgi:hypothetical protein